MEDQLNGFPVLVLHIYINYGHRGIKDDGDGGGGGGGGGQGQWPDPSMA